jgi:hypothetical protein
MHSTPGTASRFHPKSATPRWNFSKQEIVTITRPKAGLDHIFLLSLSIYSLKTHLDVYLGDFLSASLRCLSLVLLRTVDPDIGAMSFFARGSLAGVFGFAGVLSASAGAGAGV